LEAAARASLVLSRAAWVRGDREDVDFWLAEMDAFLTDVPDSIVQTEALVVRSGFHMTASEYEPAIEMARGALVRLEGVERADLRARALDVIGVSRVSSGDENGLVDQRRAIEIAREGRALWELHHATNNLGYSLGSLGRLREFEELLEGWQRVFDEVGATYYHRPWFLASRANADYFAGRWDDALARIDEFLVGFVHGKTHYVESDLRPLRALIVFARDRAPEAFADLERAVEVASRSGDPQVVAACLCVRGSLHLADGRAKAAAADFDALLVIGDPLAGVLMGTYQLDVFAWLAADLGRAEDAEVVLRGSQSRRWSSAARAILAGDAEGAADLLAEIGHRPAEAQARLRAGGENVRRALDFYRSVGGTRYVREGEELLAASV
jgi:tetratricopeptide (TPR) repeat protein